MYFESSVLPYIIYNKENYLKQSSIVFQTVKMKIQTLTIVLIFVLFHGEFFASCSQVEKCALLNKFLKCHRSFEYHNYCYETKPYDKTICCSQALKSKSTNIKSR